MELIAQIALGSAFLGAIAYLVACTLAGLRPTGQRLISYRATESLAPRRFDEPTPKVRQAYIQAAQKAAGMKVVDQRPEQILVDCKPTPRILGGMFGNVLRVSFVVQGHETLVLVDSAKKVGFAMSLWPGHALREIERTLRMRAKQLGVHEVVGQPQSGSFISNPNEVPQVFL